MEYCSVTYSMGIPRLYLIFKRDKTSQNLPEGVVYFAKPQIFPVRVENAVYDVILTNLDDPGGGNPPPP